MIRATLLSTTLMVLSLSTAVAEETVDWSGWYIGGQIGGLTGDSDWTSFDPTGNHITGTFIGVYGGYNLQINGGVFGVELEYNASGADGSNSCPSIFFSCETEIKSFGALKARYGRLTNSGLVYGFAGLATAKVDEATPSIATGIPFGTDSQTHTGFTVGLGYELMLGGSTGWSMRAEYAYNDLGTKTSPPALGGLPVDIDINYSTFNLGISKHF